MKVVEFTTTREALSHLISLSVIPKPTSGQGKRVSPSAIAVVDATSTLQPIEMKGSDLFDTLPYDKGGAQPLLQFIYELYITTQEPVARFLVAAASTRWANVAKEAASSIAFRPTHRLPFQIVGNGASDLLVSSTMYPECTPEAFFASSTLADGAWEQVEVVRIALGAANSTQGLNWSLGPSMGFRNELVIGPSDLCQLLDMSPLEASKVLGTSNEVSPQGWLNGSMMNAIARVYMPDITGLTIFDPLKKAFMPDFHWHLIQRWDQGPAELYYLNIAKSMRIFAGGTDGIKALLQLDWLSTFNNHGNTHWSFLACRLMRVNGRMAIFVAESTLIKTPAPEALVLARYVSSLSRWYDMVRPGEIDVVTPAEFDIITLSPRSKSAACMAPKQYDAKSCGIFTMMAFYAVAHDLPFFYDQTFVPYAREQFLKDFLHHYGL